MNSIVHADVFFFISTIAVVVISIIAIVALIYVLKILIEAHFIIRLTKEEGKNLIQDLAELRANLRKEGSKAASFGIFFRKIFGRAKRRVLHK